MAENLPFMNSTGVLKTVLEKMRDAQVPERFTQDFLKSKLGHSSGSAKAVIPLLKRIGFIGSDGIPTEIYSRFKNPNQSKRAMAEAIKIGYKDIFEVNENAQDLNREELKGIVLQLTGYDKDSSAVRAITGSFETLKEFAEFTAPVLKTAETKSPDLHTQAEEATNPIERKKKASFDSGNLRLGYVINLNLPETTNVAVFDAIFKSLKEHILE